MADDLANEGGYVRVDLEVSGLEPLPPIPEVEELEHLVPLSSLVMVGGGGGTASAAVPHEQDPAARGGECRDRDRQAQGQQERRLTIHGAERVPETAPAPR